MKKRTNKVGKKSKSRQGQPGLFSLLKPYKGLVFLLILLALGSNALALWLPRLLSRGIDDFFADKVLEPVFWQFGIFACLIFILAYFQSITQTYVSEKVARDLRNTVAAKISTRSFAEIQSITPSKLLTNLIVDIDSIKGFVSRAIASIISSIFLIVGGSILLLLINWKLGLSVLAVLPLIGITFYVIFDRVKIFFMKAREAIDWLNKVISESILGAPLVRVLNSQNLEHNKFISANTTAKEVGIDILKLFALMIPIVSFLASLATVIILALGGKFIIDGTMTLGEFAAFNSYLVILIFPIFILGFIGNIVAQAGVSYERILEVLSLPKAQDDGTIKTSLKGNIEIKKASLTFGQKTVLKNVSLKIKPKTKVAIIGPTAAGKTQLLNLLIGLTSPTSGEIYYENRDINKYQKENLYRQVGLVFQDSVIFSMSLRENIAFNAKVTEENLQKAIETAQLSDFITSLPKGLETIVSERGTSLSGGQKQRIMLARALAINPKVLLLDDFTARVDAKTEQKILQSITENYPDLTLVSITQKVSSVKDYDQIIVLMEGEVVSVGTHEKLMKTSPEYVQIYNSQQSTHTLQS